MTFVIKIFVVIYLSVNIIESTPLYVADEMPWQCQGKEYCTAKPPFYDEYMYRALASLDLPSVDEVPAIGPRQTPDYNECEARPNFELIYQILDENNTVRYVVQQENKFKQRLKIVECLSKDAPLRNSKYLVMNDNNVTCAETHMDYAFLVINKDGDGVEIAKTKSGIPVSCHYMIKC